MAPVNGHTDHVLPDETAVALNCCSVVIRNLTDTADTRVVKGPDIWKQSVGLRVELRVERDEPLAVREPVVNVHLPLPCLAIAVV
jgi:hypothetical protein